VRGRTCNQTFWGVGLVVVLALLASCSNGSDVADAAPEATVSPIPSAAPDDAADQEPAAEPDQEVEPQPYIPAGQPGTAQAYDEMVERLSAELPAELHDEVPWPDLRNPDPSVAQIEIFEMWIWMAEHYPDPALVEALSAPASPSREQVTGIFGRQEASNVLNLRLGNGYQAFDHVVVTFDSAGLPLWLARDVPEDAVVVYYRDSSGPMEVVDRDTGAPLEMQPPVPTRSWLAIMVPTDVGWQLYRDELIDISRGLVTPDVPPPPGPSDDAREPQL